MPAQRLNLRGCYKIEQGADYEIQIVVTDSDTGLAYDLTGATATAQVREEADGTSAVDFTASIDVPTATITLRLTNAETASFTFYDGVWDCFLETADGWITKLLMGTVEIEKEVTK